MAETRTWICPDCKEKQIGVTQDDISVSGSPICPECGSDMVVEPVEKVNLGIVVSGGVVDSVISSIPSGFDNVRIFVIDYDCDGSDDSKLHKIKQEFGSPQPANIFQMSVEQEDINFDDIIK